MKKVLCLICILFCVYMTCLSSPAFNITYDDALLYTNPIRNAEPGELVQIKVNIIEDASFSIFIDDILLSENTKYEDFVMYEFIMPNHDVKISHTIDERKFNMTNITIPATMKTYRISYATEHAFNGEYMIVTDKEMSEQLFAGFVLRNPENIQQYPRDFFENNILIAYVQYEGSGSVTHSLKNVTLNNDQLFVTITRNIPSIGTCDIATHLCLISVSKKALPEDMSVVIQIEDNRNIK